MKFHIWGVNMVIFANESNIFKPEKLNIGGHTVF